MVLEGVCRILCFSNSPRRTEEVAAAACMEGRRAEQSWGICGLEGSGGLRGEPGGGAALQWPKGGDRPLSHKEGEGRSEALSTLVFLFCLAPFLSL